MSRVLAPCETAAIGALAADVSAHVPVLRGPKLVLRAPCLGDFDAYAEIMTGDQARHMGGALDRAEAWESFTSYSALWLLMGHGLWTLETPGGAVAGFALLGYEYEDPEAEFGLFLRSAFQGQGLGAEAAKAALRFAATTLGWTQVASFVDEDNSRMVGLMQKLGAMRDSEAEASLSAQHGPGLCVFRHSLETYKVKSKGSDLD